jgi:hypothetical protein
MEAIKIVFVFQGMLFHRKAQVIEWSVYLMAPLLKLYAKLSSIKFVFLYVYLFTTTFCT